MKPSKIRRHYMTLMELLIATTLTMLLLVALATFYQQVEMLDTESERLQKENFQLRYVENRLSQIIPNTLSEKNFKSIKNFHFFTSGDLNGLLAAGKPSLVFVFDSGVSFNDKKTAERALARLYLDPQHHLCLAIWPSTEAKSKWQEGHVEVSKEILLENVADLSFEFYVAPERDRSLFLKKSNQTATEASETTPPATPEDKKKDSKPKRKENITLANEDLHQNIPLLPTSAQSWVPEWRREYQSLPAMIKIHVTLMQKDKEGNSIQVIFAYPLPYSPQLIVYEH